MKKILCPTDFSDIAKNAIAYAAKLAHATGSSLTLLHVKSVFDFALVSATAKEYELEQIENELEAQSREISRTFKISCSSEVESKIGKLSSVIADAAKGYDLIVMGTNGADDLYQFFGGSNAYNAIVKTNTPVLLIPEGYMYSEIKKIVFAFDYLRERKLPLTHLAPFVKAVNAKLTVLQIMEEALSKNADEDLRALQFIIKSYCTEEIDFEYDTIRAAAISKSIDSYLLRNQSDVLALCSVHRSLIERIFHKSVIKNVSIRTTYPVYIFHE